ncbi:MAG: hypothetical protein QNJ49_06400 [Mastigocoleus sp. MO_167.B18]|uniref:hypothetical protein n=1 Tax=Mastigocoleus sp. MO_188.B34 TaxID=3036635 RepID=UPI00262A5669|nr:hypothetical protein [Mastigocoleus sp. MO_188.B34]MDJ0694249.1 hypothetical protein [Mastigocoleus sp. MO_188.B34]MDJ0773048.1 hypothetical protein [Mastigocoleus sp. MO_167.B18]
MPKFWVMVIGLFTAILMNIFTGFYKLRWSIKDAVPATLIMCVTALLAALLDDAIAELLEIDGQFVTIPLILILVIGALTLYKEVMVS